MLSRWLPTLRPVGMDDYPELFRWASTAGVGDRWRYRMRAPAGERFVADVWGGVIDGAVALDRLGRPAALATAYNADHRSGHCWISTVSAPEHVGRGTGVAGTIAFIDRVFRDWPFERVFLEVYDYNLGGLGLLERQLSPVGRFRDELLWHGVYHDRLVYSVERDWWNETVVPFLDSSGDRRP